MEKKNIVKKDAKASVFTHLFSISWYRKELYLYFYPRDRDISEDEIKTWTLSSIFTNIQVNDLGLLVRDKILVLMEAQSTWTLNILPRMLEYLGESFNRYLIETKQNVYGSKKVFLPRPELYVMFTGTKNIKEKTISLKKEFFDNNSPIEIKVKVIVLKNSKSILKEYIEFSKVLDENNKEYGYTEKSINETIKYCIANEILKDYLSEYKKEVYNIMISAYSQEAATEMYGNERFNEGMKQGMQQGIVSILLKQFNDKKISAKEAADYLNITPEEFLELLK